MALSLSGCLPEAVEKLSDVVDNAFGGFAQVLDNLVDNLLGGLAETFGDAFDSFEDVSDDGDFLDYVFGDFTEGSTDDSTEGSTDANAEAAEYSFSNVAFENVFDGSTDAIAECAECSFSDVSFENVSNGALADYASEIAFGGFADSSEGVLSNLRNIFRLNAESFPDVFD